MTASVGCACGDQVSEQLLGCPIGVAHGGEVWFGLDAKVERTEPLERERVGSIGKAKGEGEVVGHGQQRIGPIRPRRCGASGATLR